MQITFVDTTNTLQLCFAKLSSLCIIVKSNFRLTSGFIALITKLSTLFFWLNMVNSILYICFNACNKDLLLVIYYKIC